MTEKSKRRYSRAVRVPNGKACAIFLGPEDRETLHQLGGSAWIRQQIALARRTQFIDVWRVRSMRLQRDFVVEKEANDFARVEEGAIVEHLLYNRDKGEWV